MSIESKYLSIDKAEKLADQLLVYCHENGLEGE